MEDLTPEECYQIFQDATGCISKMAIEAAVIFIAGVKKIPLKLIT
jgi:hypothetical protein